MAFGSQNSAALNVASQAGIITKGKDIFDSSHNCGREMGFELMGGRHLKKIILDDPKLKTDENVNIYSMAVGALRLAMQDANIDVPIERRRCKAQCKCKAHWSGDDERLFKMFDPKT